MFQPETEDMLPRAAPKPSAQINEGVVPAATVPEISILFGPNVQQQQKVLNSAATAATTNAQPTYAAWKKQVLPRVTFPPVGCEVTGISEPVLHEDIPLAMAPRSNVYPLRAAVTTTPASKPMFSNDTVYTNNNLCSSKELQYQRRSLESLSSFAAAPTTTGFAHINAAQQMQKRRSLEIVQQHNGKVQMTEDVLTICAGTQTDKQTPTKSTLEAVDNLATKTDIAELHGIIQEMRKDQLHLLQICEALQIQHITARNDKIFCRDIATQYEQTTISNGYAGQENCNANDQQKEAQQNNCFMQMQYAQPKATPRAVAPQAQSTAYRANTPQQNCNNNNSPIINKPSSEKSAVMNELALKYLPNEKLNEFMQELRINKTPTRQQQQQNTPSPPAALPTPLRHIENFTKNPADISNASYKYLKKYRLLPEEETENFATHKARQQMAYQATRSPKTVAQGQHVVNQLLDLDNIRNQPKFL